MERVRLSITGSDTVEADLVTTATDGPGADIDRATRTSLIVLCHPHPDYGGNRHHLLIDRLLSTLSHPEGADGFANRRAILRFDFSGNVIDGHTQRHELSAAAKYLFDRFGPQQLYLIGYSFGAQIALTSYIDHTTAIAAVACPAPPEHGPSCPVLLLVPEHDMFCGPTLAEQLTSSWDDCTIETLEMTDHFLGGMVEHIVARINQWIADHEGRQGSSRN